MAGVARMPLEGGGWILVEAQAAADGPVKAGRFSDGIRELPTSLRDALVPVTDAARTVLDQLRKAAPGGVEVEFGVDLSMQAGVVITKGETGCHLKVKLLWTGSEPSQDQD